MVGTSNCLLDLMKIAKTISTDDYSEKVARHMLALVAENCPVLVLEKLTDCLINCRLDELAEEQRVRKG